MKHLDRRRLVIASPFAVMVVSYVAARVLLPVLGRWTWVGVFPVYWGAMLLVTMWFSPSDFKKWFAKSQGSRWWTLFAVGVGVIAFPLLLVPHLDVLRSLPLAIAWLVFSMVNPVCEESYWRGLLLDATEHMPRWIGVVYSSVLFVAVHPLVFGVFARIQAFDSSQPLALIPFLTILAVLSAVWCLLYLGTHSLRLSILSHFLTDLGNLSVFVFMNMISIG